MDYYELLLYLTTIDKTEDGLINNFNERLRQILQKVRTISMKNNVKLEIDTVDSRNERNDVRYQYVRTIVHVLQNIKMNNSTNDESLYSVQQFRTLKSSVELITAIGIISCLLPGVGVDMAKTCPKALSICKEEPTDLQKYERLKFTVDSLAQLYDKVTYRPAILGQIGPLLAALLQLSHAPLTKPSTKQQVATSIPRGNKQANDKHKFTMTADLYDQLKRDQRHFACLFHELLSKCPSSTCVKELMVILGIAEAPKWLRRETRKYLIEQLTRPNGIASIVAVVCEDVLDLGQHWHKLDVISRLIVTSHYGTSMEQTDRYYKSVCSQLLSLLTSTQIEHSTVANCCIAALYECNSNVCYENIVAVMCDPLLASPENEQKVRKKSEQQVERCVERLTRCFVVTEASFKRLPPRLLTNVAVPLFSLYNDVRQSACPLKSKLKQLVLLLLYQESTRNHLFAAFLGHDLTNNFGNRLEAKLGPTAGIEIVGTGKPCKYEQLADTLLDLTLTTEVLSTELFSYLSKYLSNSVSVKLHRNEAVQGALKTDSNDTLEKIEEKLAAVKLLSNLASVSAVRQAQIKDPKSLMHLVRSLFDRYVGARLQQIRRNSSFAEEDDCEMLYVGLMLMKMILSEREEEEPLDWTVFSDFVKFLKERCVSNSISPQLLSLIRELIELVETRGKSERKRYQDLSVSRKASNKFEQALRDLADPLLPVRAHGLIVLTKLIENMDPRAIAGKMVLLQLFNENLKHEDSFIYLAAINGLCALATSYPRVVVETLVKEYIDMPQRSCSPEEIIITTETRVKLGEVLVKLTRNLGELAPAYKNILINGFLCAARDTDSLLRASSLSCLGELCKVLGFRLGDIVVEIIYCISCIVKTDKAPECRRAAVMVCTLLFRGLGKSTLTSLGRNLVDLYRGLKYLRDNDEDPALRLHAQLALEELDSIAQDFLLSSSKLEKRIVL